MLHIGGSLAHLALFRFLSIRFLGIVTDNLESAELLELITGQRPILLDFYTREEYEILKGNPPSEWKETTSEDLIEICGREFPQIIVIGTPMIPVDFELERKCDAVFESVFRTLELCLCAFAEQLPDNIVFENADRMRLLGQGVLSRIETELKHAGYAVDNLAGDNLTANRMLKRVSECIRISV